VVLFIMLRGSIIASILCIAVAVKDGNQPDVCFDDLGCFSMSDPFYNATTRPIYPPQDPKKINVYLRFYSRDSKKGINITVYPEVKMGGAKYKGDREKTIVILSGMGQHASWPGELKDAFLGRIDANVFVLYALEAFNNLNVFQIVSTARVVAAKVAKFLDYLKKNEGLTTDKIYLVGFGIGAHVAAYVGDRTRVGRITGLDPMQNLFEGFPKEVHLDKTDADYVDILHSDSRPIIPDVGFGFMNPYGHVDFYLNGAHGQPGCRLPRPWQFKSNMQFLDLVRENTRLAVATVACAHRRAYKVFIESINSTKCIFWGYEGDKQNFLKAISNAGSQGLLIAFTALYGKCDYTTCVPLGLDSPKSNRTGVHIITTNHQVCKDKSIK